MVLSLEDHVWTDLGQILYLRLRGELRRGSQVAADLTSIPEAQQQLVLRGLRERAEPDLHPSRRYGSDDKESPFPLLTALWKAGADVPVDGLHAVLRHPLTSDHFDHARPVLKHLYWLERAAEDPIVDNDQGYNLIQESFFDEEVRGRRAVNAVPPILRPAVVQTSPQLHQPGKAITDAHFFDALIAEEISAAERFLKQEQEELERSKGAYSAVKDGRAVLSRLRRARDIAAIQRGKGEADRDSLEDLAFFDSILPPEDATRLKHELALRQALESPAFASAQLLYNLSTTPEECDNAGRILTERRVDRYDLDKMVETSLRFFERGAELRRQSSQEWESYLTAGRRYIADSIAQRGNIPIAKQFYAALGIVAPEDEATFQVQLIRVADEITAQLEPQNYNQRELASSALKLYEAGYPAGIEIPLDKLNLLFAKTGMLSTETREKFFLAAYGERPPQSVLETFAKSRLREGKLDLALELYARAGQEVTADAIFEAGKELLEQYSSDKERAALDYFKQAIQRGHRKLTFRDFFEAYESKRFRFRDEDRDKHKLREIALKLPAFIDILDLTTDTYDYHQPTDTEYVPSAFTDLAFHYAIHGQEERAGAMYLDALLALGAAFHRPVDAHILNRITELIRQGSHHIDDFVQQLNTSSEERDRPREIKFAEEKTRLYPLAVHRALENLLDFGSERANLNDNIIFFLQEKTRIAQQAAGVPVYVKDTKKEDDARLVREHHCHHDAPFPGGWPRPSSHDFIRAVRALPAPEAVAIQDNLYLKVAGRVARRALSTVEKIVKPAEGALDKAQREYQSQTYLVHSLGSLALRVVRDITNLPSAPKGEVVDAHAVGTYRIAKGNLEAIARLGEAFMAGRIEQDNGFELGWYLLQRSSLPISESAKEIVRARYETLRERGDVTRARQEAQRIGEFTRDKALMLARRALRNANINAANELYGMYQEWHESYASAEPETAIPRSVFAELFQHIPIRAGLGKVHIHPGEVNVIADELLGEGNALGVVRLEKALDEAGLVVHEGKPSSLPQKIRIDNDKFLPVIRQYLERGDWRSLAELHEQRSDLNVSQKVWTHYRGQLPDVATMKEEDLRYAAKIMPTHFRLPETVEAVVARAEARGSRYLAETVLEPDAMSTSQWYDAVFSREFNADRVGRGFQFTTYDKTIANARKVLDDQAFLRQIVEEGNEHQLRQIAYAALHIRYDASENAALQQIIASQRPFLASIIGEILNAQMSDRIGSTIEYHNGRQEVVATIAGIAAYLGDEVLPQFVATNFPSKAPEPVPTGYSGGGIFKSDSTLRAA